VGDLPPLVHPCTPPLAPPSSLAPIKDEAKDSSRRQPRSIIPSEADILAEEEHEVVTPSQARRGQRLQAPPQPLSHGQGGPVLRERHIQGVQGPGREARSLRGFNPHEGGSGHGRRPGASTPERISPCKLHFLTHVCGLPCTADSGEEVLPPV
jgi:hypothetical protein